MGISRNSSQNALLAKTIYLCETFHGVFKFYQTDILLRASGTYGNGLHDNCTVCIGIIGKTCVGETLIYCDWNSVEAPSSIWLCYKR